MCSVCRIVFYKYKPLLPAVILLGASLHVFLISAQTFSFRIQHYAGLLAAILCVSAFFLFRKLYKPILIITLLLGLSNVLHFTPNHITTTLYITSLSASFQPFSFFIILLSILLALPQKSEIREVASEKITAFKQDQFREEREKFEHLFNAKTQEELKEILENKGYTASAKEAAKQLLAKRSLQHQ